MPKGDEKYLFSDKMVLKYPELKEFITNRGRFNKLKKKEILLYKTIRHSDGYYY